MTTREKIAYLNLRKAGYEQSLEITHRIAARPDSLDWINFEELAARLGVGPSPLVRELGPLFQLARERACMEHIEAFSEQATDCENKISQIREIEIDLAA